MAPSPSYPPESPLYPDAPLTVKELPPAMRPREEFERRGADNVPDEILIAILLRSGVPGKNVTELARELLRRSGGLEALSRADYHELRGFKLKGLGKVKCMELAAALELGRRAALHHHASRRDDHPIPEPASPYRLLAPLAPPQQP